MERDKSTILIVDDDPSIRIALREVLEDNYNLVEAETGEETLRILQERQDVDLVLLDYLLPPGIDGLEVLKRMKTLNNAAPVVFITGKGSEDVAVRAFRLGICDYISKPFKIMRLREIIKMNIFSKEINMPYVKKTFKFIETHYDQPISARDVSENVGISLSHLEHIFKKQVNNTITYYITSFRINEAKKLLRSRNLSIKEIAYEVGFNSQNFFLLCSV